MLIEIKSFKKISRNHDKAVWQVGTNNSKEEK